MKSRSHGFSLVELMIGMVIMAILMAVAVPSFQAWLLNVQIRNAAENIQLGLQRARAEAVARNTDVSFVLAPVAAQDQVSWTVQLPGGGGGPNGEPFDKNVASEGSKSVLRAVLPVGATTVTFNNSGGLVVPGVNIASVALDVDPVLLPAAQSQDLVVTVSTLGTIRMCDPNVVSPNSRACN
jgi:type IV fimbrial biogenesis protein FimT